MAHICSRESCPTANVNGPKSTCIKCKKICYLMCFGAEKSTTGMVRLKLQNDMTIYVEIKNAQFACGGCVLEGNVVIQTTMQLTQKVEAGVSSIDEVTNNQLMEALKSGFMDLRGHIDANMEKNQTDVKKCIQDVTNTVMKTSTESLTTPLYSTVLRSKRKSLFMTPVSGKRKRLNDNDEHNGDSDEHKMAKQRQSMVPKPLYGRSEAVIGQKPKPKELGTWNRRVFEKSLRVAGLDPSTTVEELSEFLVTHTSSVDKSKFNCVMLVKKGQDLSELTYVSAKIDVSSEDFENLLNMDLWPNYVTVREFIRMDKRNQRQTENIPMSARKFQQRNGEQNDRNELQTNSTVDANLNSTQSNMGFRGEGLMHEQN